MVRDTVIDDQYEAYAKYVFEKCCNWFGTPEDHAWPVYFKSGIFNSCHRISNCQMYWIAINKDELKSSSAQRIKHVIGSMMYYRTVGKSRGLNRLPWVNIMLAEESALRALTLAEEAEYVDSFETQCRHGDKLTDGQIVRLKSLWSMVYADPEANVRLLNSVKSLVSGLRVFVTWKDLSRLHTCVTWREWIGSLREEARTPVALLLSPLLPQESALWAEFDNAKLTLEQILNLAQIQWWRGHFTHAIDLCDHAQKIDPQCARLYQIRTWIYHSRGDSDATVASIEQAMQLDPENMEYMVTACMAYLRAGRIEDARTRVALIDDDARTREDLQPCIKYVDEQLASK